MVLKKLENTFHVEPDASLQLSHVSYGAVVEDFYKIDFQKWESKENVVLDSDGRPKV